MAIQELKKNQSQFTFGVLIFSKQSAFELLVNDKIVEKALAVISANVDPNVNLKNATWKEVSCLPLDHPNAIIKDDEIFNSLSLHFYFYRKYPLIKYSMVTTECIIDNAKDKVQNSEDEAKVIPNEEGTESQVACKDSEIVEDKISTLLYIKPSLAPDCPPVLVTGNSPITRIAKLENFDNEILSVFFVPHQESKECLSLLPLEVREQICNSEAIRNAALHLALYHMKEILAAIMERLKGTKLEERGKSFLRYYCNKKNCNPEADLEPMLHDPDVKISQFLHIENSQLKWYKNQIQGAFSEISASVAEEECKQQRRMELFRESLAWAHFYKHIKAELFVLSAEDLHERHMHAVLNGIIIANNWRKTKCCIVITDTLPYSLDEVFQRDVRRLVFSKGKSEPLIRVGFLDKTSTKRGEFPFFTINPWSQTQLHTPKYHTISVNTSEHLVDGLGEEYQLHLIRDDLDIKERISTNISNAIIGHITHNPRPPLSGACIYKYRLESFLKEIGYKITCESYGLDDVLKCLLGQMVVFQLEEIASKNIPNFEVIPELLKLKAKGNSTFHLTPTKCSAFEAEIDIFISKSKPLLIAHKKITKASVTVKKAKTESVIITFNVNINSKPVPLHVGKHLDLSGSCGSTIADYIYGICCKEDAWFRARELTVGEVLHIYLRKEKALAYIQSLPLFFSYSLSKCKINHYLTTVLVDSSQTLQEGHIYVTTAFNLSPVCNNKVKFSICIKSLAVHFSPSHNFNKRIQIEGKCIVNSAIMMKFSCSSTEDSNKSMNFFFDKALPANEVFKLFGIQNLPSSLSQPPGGICLNDEETYEGGFVLSQNLKNSEEATFTSLLFGLELDNKFQNLLPTSLSHIQDAKTKITIHSPSRAPKLGIEASFTSKLEVSKPEKNESVILNCCLFVSPLITNNSYKYEISIQQSSSDISQELRGMSIYSVISALTHTQGRHLVEEIENIPHLGDQILHNMSLTKILLEVLDREIQFLEIHAYIAQLDVVPSKLSVHECLVTLFYSREGLKPECKGHLKFLRNHNYLIHFCLPTAEKKGKLEFTSYSSDLTLCFLMEELGLLSDAKSNPVLAEVLDTVIKRVSLEFSILPKQGKLQISSSDITVFKDKLDISLVTLHDIELTISTKLVNNSYVHAFSLGAYISDAYFAELQYNPDDHVMSGKVNVTFSKFVSAVDTLQTFKPCSSSYDNMKSILEKEFMDVFNSDMRILAEPGMTATLYISISLPFGNTKFSLKHLKLEVEDALRVCCKNTYVLNTFQFEYTNKNETTVSHLLLAVHSLNSKENMTLDFDFTTKTDNTSFFTAKVKAGPQGGFLKLRSAIDLAKAAIPDLPNFEVGLPPIFEIELLSGSITFTTKPSFKPTAFDINILITEWQVFGDPKLKVHRLTLKTNWETGKYPQLLFTDCTLTFLEHQLGLEGKLTAEEVYIQCSSANKSIDSKPAYFQSVLEECTPSSQDQPVVPANIGLPSMEIELKEFIVQLKENYKKFRVNAGVVAKDWTIKFGSHSGAPIIPVHDLGGALEWKVKKNDTSYKAFLYGTIELFDLLVCMEMLLGKNIDAIASAKVENSFHYGQISDSLVYSKPIVPYEQYNPQSSGLAQLAPSNIQDISLTSADVFLNVTKQQFFLSSRVKGWGIGSIWIGYLKKKREMDYIISLSVEEGFKFGIISESLAFVDELLLLRNLKILTSSTSISCLSELTNQFRQSFSESRVIDHLKKPFYESRIISSNKLASEFKIQEGTTIYAEVDIVKSQGINQLLQLGDHTIGNTNIAIMTYIGKSKTDTNLEVHAWITKILLCEKLEFSDIHLIYKVQKASEFELSGTVALDLELEDTNTLLKFDGKLSVDSVCAKFKTKNCKEIVYQPCGIHIAAHDLNLALVLHFNRKCDNILVIGKLEIGKVSLSCKFYLNDFVFKVFLIKINRPLELSDLFDRCSLDWPIELDITIKEGDFYYAVSRAKFEENGRLVEYESGYHLKGTITLLGSDFEIKGYMPSDRSDVVICGRGIEPVDFVFAKITGARSDTYRGPELIYSGAEESLSLSVGVEILKIPLFEGELKYKINDNALEGTIRYLGHLLWIIEPSVKVRWSPDNGFDILDFSFDFKIPGFSVLGVVAKFAKVIYNMIKGLLSCSAKFNIKTAKNPNPNMYQVKLIFSAEFVVTVFGFKIPIRLPKIPFLLPRIKNFSFERLPEYILTYLWDHAGAIYDALREYINPWNIVAQTGKVIWNGFKQVRKTVDYVANKVCDVANKVCDFAVKTYGAVKKGVKKFFSWFGRSAFIVDMDNGMLLGYIHSGKGGRNLCNERYIIKQFGPILTVNAIGTMACDIHKHYKTCLDAHVNDEVKGETQDNETTCDDMDGEEIDLDKGLEDLKGKAEELYESWTIMADKILIMKDICIKIDEQNGNISVEWFTYNPDEDSYYNEDKGDIEYHLKVSAVLIEHNEAKVVNLYDEIFLNRSTQGKIDSVETENYNDVHHQQTKELIQENTMNDRATLHEQSIGEDASSIEQQKDRIYLSISDADAQQLKTIRKAEDKIEPIAEDCTSSDQKSEDEVESIGQEEPQENSEEVQCAVKETNFSDPYENKSEPSKLRKCITLNIPCNSKMIKQMVCMHVSIQPKVTLEVKMLPPDKIATDEYMINAERIKENDTSWMDDAKKEILKNGRVSEVTLEGRRVSMQHFIHSSTLSNISFTVKRHHEKNGMTVVSGDITPLSKAERHLIQLLDDNDQTVIIKQLLMPPQMLHYVIEVEASEFPATSSGPYSISILALHSDLISCSAVTKSDLKLERYSPPEELKLTIPNLDSSSEDIIKLEWRHPKELMNKDDSFKEDLNDNYSCLQEKENIMMKEDSPNPYEGDSEETACAMSGDGHDTPTKSSTTTKSGNFYLFTISAIHIEKIQHFKVHEINIKNVNRSDEAFKMTEQICMNHDFQEIVHHEFSLKNILTKSKHKMQGGLLFQCQVVTDGDMKLLSMPKLFSEFVLLASPTNFKAAADEGAGFHIQWDYCAHAIEYRIELVDEHNSDVAFSRVIKCTEGSHGKINLCNIDFKDISALTSNKRGYKWHIHSLGFSQELIRCLEPSVAEGKFHFIQSTIKYLEHSDIIQVKFVPSVRAQYMNKLYQKNQNGDILTLAVNPVYCHKANKEALVNFQVKKVWHLIKSGNSVFAWIYCTTKATGRTITYIGAPHEDTHVLNFPQLKGSFSCNSNFSINSLKIEWSAVEKAEKYQYGYYFPDKNECVSIMETQETEALVKFDGSSLKLLHDIYCQFQVYTVAKERQGTGELSLYSTLLQCIKSPSLKECGAIVFSAVTLQQYIWIKHIATCKPLALYNPQYILFPSGRPFPNISVPKKFREKFWKTESSSFGKGKNWD